MTRPGTRLVSGYGTRVWAPALPWPHAGRSLVGPVSQEHADVGATGMRPCLCLGGVWGPAGHCQPPWGLRSAPGDAWLQMFLLCSRTVQYPFLCVLFCS